MGYLLIAAFAVVAVGSWRSPASDARFLSRLAAVMAIVIATQMWWQL